ncbi:MAG: hypothetical protein U1F76_10515 [Candidatus Competibacteraceae bacterium]
MRTTKRCGAQGAPTGLKGAQGAPYPAKKIRPYAYSSIQSYSGLPRQLREAFMADEQCPITLTQKLFELIDHALACKATCNALPERSLAACQAYDVYLKARRQVRLELAKPQQWTLSSRAFLPYQLLDMRSRWYRFQRPRYPSKFVDHAEYYRQRSKRIAIISHTYWSLEQIEEVKGDIPGLAVTLLPCKSWYNEHALPILITRRQEVPL